MPCCRTLAALLALGGCFVYAPMQPIAPAVRQARQSELMPSLQPIGRVEVTGAYSPASRVLVTGGVTGALRLGEKQFLETRQYEVGMGYYQPLGRYWVLSGLGGFGQAYSHRGRISAPLLGTGAYHGYESRYRKTFGRVGAVYQRHVYGFGLAYRLVKTDFEYLNDSRLGPLPLSSATWHELAVSNRVQLGRHRQLVNTVGLAVAGTPRLGYHGGTADYIRVVDEANRNLAPAVVLSVGAVYQLGPCRVVPRKARASSNQPPVPPSVRRQIWADRFRDTLRRLLPCWVAHRPEAAKLRRKAGWRRVF